MAEKWRYRRNDRVTDTGYKCDGGGEEKAAETARELRDLKRKEFILRSALIASIEDNELAWNYILLWRCISALECIVILSLLAIHFFS